MGVCSSHRGIDIPNGSAYFPHIIYHLVRYKFVKGFVTLEDDILDIACGTGYGTRLLSDYCKSVTGVDINKDTVNYATEIYGGENRKFRQGNILDIKGQYDIIVCYETIEHITESEGLIAVEKLKQCLKPNGLLFISSPKEQPLEERSMGRSKFHKFEYSYDNFFRLLKTYFARPVIFSQTDEIISIGNHKAVWTYIGVCWNS